MTQTVQEVDERLRPHALGQPQVLPGIRLAYGIQHLAPKHRHHNPRREQKPLADGLPLPVRSQPTACHQAVEMRMQHQGLTPGVQGHEDTGLRPEILGGRQ